MINKGFTYLLFVVMLMCVACSSTPDTTSLPNVIMIMADDLGYGDLACYGNTTAITPCIDAMAESGVKFTRFYASSPVCSPTRGSCLTGRHPFRYGIKWAGDGHLPLSETTIAEALKTQGYATGHFGKWHVGQMSKTIKQSYFDGDVDTVHFSPPWLNGFDECFSTESMMPTYNPYYQVGGDYGSDDYKFVQDVAVEDGQQTGGFVWRDFYWTADGEIAKEYLQGDDSKIIMDKALAFINKKAKASTPFLSLIWFHTPHTPVAAGESHRSFFSDKDMQNQHWFGAIKAMDEQVGRLREELKAAGVADNTILWFCSDNGPSYIHDLNSAGDLRGKKATLFEGGIRVPAILEYPEVLKDAMISDLPVSTSDMYPTLLALCGIDSIAGQAALDGRDVMGEILNNDNYREDPICFQSPLPGRLSKSNSQDEEQYAIIDNQYKLISVDDGLSYQLYDLSIDIAEQKDISEEYPKITDKLKIKLTLWRESSAEDLDEEVLL